MGRLPFLLHCQPEPTGPSLRFLSACCARFRVWGLGLFQVRRGFRILGGQGLQETIGEIRSHTLYMKGGCFRQLAILCALRGPAAKLSRAGLPNSRFAEFSFWVTKPRIPNPECGWQNEAAFARSGTAFRSSRVGARSPAQTVEPGALSGQGLIIGAHPIPLYIYI